MLIQFTAGKFNRVLGISLDNGKEVVARMPFPSAGPPRLMTCSEVATMDFLRTLLDAPIPKVLARDASSDNAVGTEYIIMEKCPGRTLPLNKPAPGSSVDTVQVLMAELSKIPFSQYGSIYYKEDVDSSLQGRSLYADPEIRDECSERFRIGPCTQRRFYRGGRSALSIDRGPWTDVMSYIEACVDCEIEWIETYSNTPDAQNQPGALYPADDHISALEDWIELAPVVLPKPQYCIPTLSHPFTEALNVIFDPKTEDITIIDWQNAAVLPLFETKVPPFICTVNNYVKVSKSAACMAQDFGLHTSNDFGINVAKCNMVEGLAYNGVNSAPDLYAVLDLSRYRNLRQAIWYSSHSYSESLLGFKKCLVDLASAYGDDIPLKAEYPFCPISFTEEETAKIQEGECSLFFERQMYGRIQKALEDRLGISLGDDGSVAQRDFKVSKAAVAIFHAGSGRNMSGEDRDIIMSLYWPTREGKYTQDLESCI